MHDVAIAGAGPVGLLLASELAQAGCSVIVFERDEAGHSPMRALPLGLRGLNAGSAEALYRRGMLGAAVAASGVDPSTVGADLDATRPPLPRSVSHVAGIEPDPSLITPADLPHRLPSPAADGFMTSLDALEGVLADRALALGVEIVRGAPVTDIRQGDGSVTVQAGGASHRATWLVGCDGGRSSVRRAAGFRFVGTDPVFTGYVAQVVFDDAQALPAGFTVTPRGMFLRTPFEGHVGMMDADGGAFDRSQPLTAEHLQSVLRRISGLDVTLREVVQASSFTDRAMQATSYRRGRVLLAGDAAHIHAPLGGQGLNLGLGDAMNLGWKLAATIRDDAPDDLLDSYDTERHPVGESVLDWSRAQVAAMTPGPNTPALRELLADLLSTREGVLHAHRRTSGLWHRYDFGDPHPLVGRTAPDFRFADGPSLGHALQGGTGVLLDFTSDRSLADEVSAWADRLVVLSGTPRESFGLCGVLVRPDGVVAWTHEATAPGTAKQHSTTEQHSETEQQSAALSGLRVAITRWFGKPDPQDAEDRETTPDDHERSLT